MANAFVQIAIKSFSSTTQAIVNISASGSKQLLVCFSFYNGAADFSSISDSAGNTWSLATGPVTLNSIKHYCHYAVQNTGGSTTVTVNATANNGSTAIVLEFSGLIPAQASVFTGQASSGSSVASSSVSCSSFNTTPGNLIASALGSDLGVSETWTAGANYTLSTLANPGTSQVQYRLSAGSSETAPATVGTGTSLGTIAVEFATNWHYLSLMGCGV